MVVDTWDDLKVFLTDQLAEVDKMDTPPTVSAASTPRPRADTVGTLRPRETPYVRGRPTAPRQIRASAEVAPPPPLPANAGAREGEPSDNEIE